MSQSCDYWLIWSASYESRSDVVVKIMAVARTSQLQYSGCLSISLFRFVVYKRFLSRNGERCVNAGAMLWEQAERWVFGQSSSMMMLCDLNSRRLALSPFGARSSSCWNGYLSHAERDCYIFALYEAEDGMAWQATKHQTGCHIVQSSISFVCEVNSMPIAIDPRLAIINCSLFELRGASS